MITIQEIKELKEYYTKTLYFNVREEQKTDETYRTDTFDVPEVRKPHRVWRSGIGARMVDAPAEQIVTSNPQAFFEMLKDSKGAEEIATRLSKEVNQVWMSNLRLQNPNPFKESVKNKLSRGENYIKLCHNEAWVTGEKLRHGLPVLFLILDPMVIYGSPEEDDCGWIPNIGIPNRVIIFYQRQPRDVIARYPTWTNPNKAGERYKRKKLVDWFEYWDKDSRYWEADEESIFADGIQTNPYGFVPFVRKFSGFGRRSPEGKLEDLIVSDIRLSRDLIKQECITRSNIASIEHIYAHRPRTITSPTKINKESMQENLTFGAYDLNILEAFPEGAKFTEDLSPHVPPEMYANLASIRAEIAQRNPFITAGFPLGASGRHEDIMAQSAMRRYDTVIENTETEWATAIEMALKICKVIPTLCPDGLKDGDLDASFSCSMRLKAKDPVEEDRLATLGSRLVMAKEIDPETNLIEFKGYTQERAIDILVNILKWNVLLGSPDIAELIGLRAAEKAGMAQDLEMIRARRQQLEQQSLQPTPPATTKERIMGEVETQVGAEAGTQSIVGARKPPISYSRGGVK